MSAVAALDSTIHGDAAPRSVRRSTAPRLRLVPTGEAVAAHAEGPLRLTRAGRLVISSIVLLVVLAVALVGFMGGAAATGVPTTVTVQPGQTLSEIAAKHLSGVSIATGVAELQEANDLPSAQVQAGQTIVIPQ